MRAEYKEIYGKLSNDYSEAFTPSYTVFDKKQNLAARWVSDAVRSEIDKLDLNSRIRRDAYHFLVVNFHQMIVMPLLMNPKGPFKDAYQPMGDTHYKNDFYDVISDDIHTILVSASKNKDQYAISGHAILDAVAKQYKNLRTTQFQIWG